jgi:hypothetical protein
MTDGMALPAFGGTVNLQSSPPRARTLSNSFRPVAARRLVWGRRGDDRNSGRPANECDTVVRTVPATELQRTLDEMESTLDLRTDMCPHCGKVNVFLGFLRILAYICRECGRLVNLELDASWPRSIPQTSQGVKGL